MSDTQKENEGLVLNRLERVKDKFAESREKINNLQLQLITIAGATFSIYLAFGNSTSSHPIKLGFIYLAGSLILGLISVICGYFYVFGSGFVALFDIERSILKSEELQEFKISLTKAGYRLPFAYDQKLDPDSLSGNRKTGAEIYRKLITDGLNLISSLFAGLQFTAILVASILFFIGLVRMY